MRFKKYPSLARAADALKKRGFIDQFILKGNTLLHMETGKLFDTEDMAIVEYHRFFPRTPHRSEVSIIFALEGMDGSRGLLTASYNAYGKVNLLEFMDRVKIKSRKESTV